MLANYARVVHFSAATMVHYSAALDTILEAYSEAHSVIGPLHVLEQQLPQQLRRGHNPLPLGAVLGQFPLRLPR